MFAWLFGKKKELPITVSHEGDGRHEHDVVGESFRMDTLRLMMAGVDEESSGWIKKETKALLVPVSDNPHDKNAVEVRIEDQHIGFLSRDWAKHYRNTMKENRLLVNALIVGKWTPEGGNFGVKLDIE
jgi:hypothetical protein